jgi:preprotein translocase SecE subunit
MAVNMEKIKSFIKEAYQELVKCTWLARKDVVRSTFAVSVVVLLVAIYVSLVDFGLSVVLGSILGGR